jgi:hypothetical protein
LNGNVYVLDYAQKTNLTPNGKWYIYNNIPASQFLEMGGYLYFASLTEGLLYKFYKEAENANSYNDDGAAIVAYWKSKPLSFGTEERNKCVDSLYVGLKPASKTSLSLSYETDKKKVDLSGITDLKFNLFSFNRLDFTNFSFFFSSFPKEFKMKIKEKNVSYFQLTVTNDKVNESLSILSLVIKYTYQNFIK